MPRFEIVHINSSAVDDARRRIHITREQLCQKAGVSIGTYRSAMHGNPVMLRTAQRIAAALELSTSAVIIDEKSNGKLQSAAV